MASTERRKRLASCKASLSVVDGPKSDKCVPILSPLTRQKDDVHDHLSSSLKSHKDWAFIKSLDSLDLSLEELAHIRSQLTKAELEEKNIGKELFKSLETGRLCFVCEKTRFGVFSWASVCTLCSKYVCSKCTTKIKLPGDHLRDIPVSILSSQLLCVQQPEPDSENSLIRRFSNQLGISGSYSSPTSPASSKNNGTVATTPTTSPAVSLFRQSTSPNLKESASASATRPAALNRNGWNRSSLRNIPSQSKHNNKSQPINSNRAKLVRAKTMGKNDVERIKSMKLSQPGTMHTVCTNCRSVLTCIVRAKQESEKLSKIKSRLASFQEEL